jgi:hypothetical protein
MYFAGDGAKKDDDGDIWLLGRVDDVMNVSGHRLSTTEIESALVSHPKVAEAAVVGANDEQSGQAVVAFVILREEAGDGGPDVVADLRAHVAKQIGAIAKPKSIMVVPELPKTRSGKIMRRLLRDVAENRTVGDVTTLADSTVMDQIKGGLEGSKATRSSPQRHAAEPPTTGSRSVVAPRRTVIRVPPRGRSVKSWSLAAIARPSRRPARTWCSSAMSSATSRSYARPGTSAWPSLEVPATFCGSTHPSLSTLVPPPDISTRATETLLARRSNAARRCTDARPDSDTARSSLRCGTTAGATTRSGRPDPRRSAPARRPASDCPGSQRLCRACPTRDRCPTGAA